MSLYQTKNVAHLTRRPRVPNLRFEQEMADHERHEREASRRREEITARLEEQKRLRRIEREGVQKAAALSLAEHIRDYFPMDAETHRKVWAVFDTFLGRDAKGSGRL